MTRDAITNAIRDPIAVTEGSMKNQCATIAESKRDSSPGRKPPYHVEMTIAGKKKTNGRAVGPTPRDNASRAAHPARTIAAATP
jgi:hypothetical protein